MTTDEQIQVFARNREMSDLFAIRLERKEQLIAIGEWKPERDEPWLDEARQWAKQAESDMIALIESQN